MGAWDDANRQILQALIDALECPKCHQANIPGRASIEYDKHLQIASCGCCGACWVVKPAA